MMNTDSRLEPGRSPAELDVVGPACGAPRRGRSALVILAAWTLVALIVSAQAYLTSPQPGFRIFRIFMAESLAWYFWALATPFVLWMGRRYPLVRVRWKMTAALHLLCATSLVTLHTAFVVPVIYAFEILPTAPGATELFLFRASIRFHVGLLVYGAILAVGHAIDRTRQLSRREASFALSEARLVQARLDVLRMQLRPHFVFNTLNTAAMLIREEESERALGVLVNLSELLRSVLRDGPELGSLSEELDLLRSYVAVERLRHDESLWVRYRIDPAALGESLPRLILQPLVENALRHGATDDGIDIEIVANRRAGRLEVEILDRGPGLAQQAETGADGIGLQNVRDRLSVHYGKEHDFVLEDRSHGGVRALISIPAREDTHVSS